MGVGVGGEDSPPPSGHQIMRQPTRANLLLAYGIVEYGAALAHLTAMDTAGVDVPEHLRERVHAEYVALLDRWLWSEGDNHGPEGRFSEVLQSVKEWLRDNITEMEQLLDEERDK